MTIALYETEPIGVAGEHEAVRVFHFNSENCRDQFRAFNSSLVLKDGTSSDAIEGTACDWCGVLLNLEP